MVTDVVTVTSRFECGSFAMVSDQFLGNCLSSVCRNFYCG